MLSAREQTIKELTRKAARLLVNATASNTIQVNGVAVRRNATKLTGISCSVSFSSQFKRKRCKISDLSFEKLTKPFSKKAVAKI